MARNLILILISENALCSSVVVFSSPSAILCKKCKSQTLISNPKLKELIQQLPSGCGKAAGPLQMYNTAS